MRTTRKYEKTTLDSSKRAVISVLHIFVFNISFQAPKGALMLLLKIENMALGQHIDEEILISWSGRWNPLQQLELWLTTVFYLFLIDIYLPSLCRCILYQKNLECFFKEIKTKRRVFKCMVSDGYLCKHKSPRNLSVNISFSPKELSNFKGPRC